MESAMTTYRYGLPQAQQVAGKSGREILQSIIDGALPQAPISETLDFWLVEVGDGFAAFEGEPGRHLLNPMGTVHGGWALTLIDSVAGSAGHSLLPAGTGYTTIETKGNFARPITKDTGRVRAEARAVAQGRQIISSEARILGPDGRVLAHGTSTILRSPPAAGAPDVPVLQLGGRLSYGEAGFGEDVVFVHGSPGDGRAWARVVRALPPGVRALTPDLPGSGGSDPIACAAAQRTQAMADGVGALIRERAAPVWLCGHSYGGNVALHAAIAHRELVRGLLLIEPVFLRGLDLANEQDVLVNARAFFTTYLVRVAFAEPDAVGMMVDFWFGSGAYARMPSAVRRFLNGAAHGNAEDVEATLAETIGAAELAAFDPPVVIAVGEASPTVTGTIAQALAALLPRARVARVRGAGHGMLDSHPHDVARLINDLRSTADGLEEEVRSCHGARA
jgi:uncharacterized protein (TIGR00369 family)